jgi:hypothetical protein
MAPRWLRLPDAHSRGQRRILASTHQAIDNTCRPRSCTNDPPIAPPIITPSTAATAYHKGCQLPAPPVPSTPQASDHRYGGKRSAIASPVKLCPGRRAHRCGLRSFKDEAMAGDGRLAVQPRFDVGDERNRVLRIDGKRRVRPESQPKAARRRSKRAPTKPPLTSLKEPHRRFGRLYSNDQAACYLC